MTHNQEASRFQPRIRKRTVMLAYWTAGWLFTVALLAFGPKFLWDKAAPVTLAGFGLCLLVGVGMIVANKNLLRDQDELQRKVQLDAMAITLGVLVITAVPYSMLELYDLAPFEAGISPLMVLLSLTYLISLFVGMSRYR